MMMKMRRPSAADCGFTLIELLVAIAVLALLAVMSWRGIDGMTRAQSQLRERADAVLTLQASLAQWNSDLDNAVAMAPTRTIDWSGRALRLTRRSSAGGSPAMLVVAWTLRGDATGMRWERWQSVPLSTRGDWQQAWQQAGSWAQEGNNSIQGGSAVALMPVASWQVLYFRNDAWGPAVSAEALGTNVALPDGVRLLLELPPGAGLSGAISLDWVRPNATYTKS
ncbi:PulJ/GspJ family protein [Variovorax sp. LARHSF232]